MDAEAWAVIPSMGVMALDEAGISEAAVTAMATAQRASGVDVVIYAQTKALVRLAPQGDRSGGSPKREPVTSPASAPSSPERTGRCAPTGGPPGR
ncbi:MAG: hypothetical protein M3N68_06285 [Actinomycetota bacterium]|nr:hypothetical protein [Actinomycetota bacterium]